MAKGAIAKENVTKIIAKAFGSDFVGEFDKKLYVWADENGEKVQIAIAMTCPKNPVGGNGNLNFDAEPGNSLNFENMSAAVASAPTFTPAEISEEEKKNIADLMARLGL
jgi:hypothetical protein